MDQEDIFPADILFDFNKRFAVREWFDGGLAQFDADIGANSFGQGRIRRAAENLHKESVVSLK